MLIVVLLKQILIMAILMAVGVFLSRKGFLSAQGSKDIGAILLRIVIPCVIVRSYLTEYTPEKMEGFLYSLLFALIAYVLAMAISYVVYGKRRRIDNFSAAFCNAGLSGFRWCRQ